MLTFAVTAASLSNDIRAAAELARRAGFAGLVAPAHTAEVDLAALSDSGSREYRHILVSFDQKLVAIDCALGKDGFAPNADIDRALARLEKVIAAAAGLGRAMVCLDLGPLPPAPVVEKPKPTITPEQAGLILIPDLKPAASAQDAPAQKLVARNPAFEASLDHALRALGQAADRHGVIVAMRSGLASLASLEFALNTAGCAWFGVDLDTVHALADDWSSDETFSRIGPLVRHVRARDAARGAGGRVVPCAIGEGNVNWRELLSNLEGVDYRGWLTLDTTDLPNRAAAASAGLQSLSLYAGRGLG